MAIESASGNVDVAMTPSIRPGKASATCSPVYAPPEPPMLTVKEGTPKVSMKCSFPIIVVSPARKGLQLFVGWLRVLVKIAYPSPSRVTFTPVSGFTPSAPPWRYHPVGQPDPCTAINRRFQAGGGLNGVGAGSVRGLCNIAFW